ncbi:hypothetical protein MNEG_6714 [Monoraphidium neglectum]|uniref:Golgi apparatus protein 1 n=1 Tax=Monoraphidium neglectum TaxID=145388 RepID=A0A0D2L1Q0_9CHLO|nr:hypothetical protein MNEG_6714 [Monoraphidium neglectum]KIZ01249.1 hypothetical protein MNEG_6714 [Monoraphidium neglectum]|eukprot:XP_013900268.1 hypothetical protein MNEG_6714 [Monoraphidium neglectum]
MASADFGDTCQATIMQKLHRREGNWRLDPPLRRACKADAEKLCPNEAALRSDDGAVKKCLAKRAGDLADGCRRELARSLHMSFFVWWPKGAVTAACDEDVARLCLIGHPTLHQMPGAVGACLARAMTAIAAHEAQAEEDVPLADRSGRRRRLLDDDDDDDEDDDHHKDEHKDDKKDERKHKEDAKEQRKQEKEQGKAEGAGGKGEAAGKDAKADKGGEAKREQPPLHVSDECRVLLALAEPPQLPSPFDAAGAAVRAAVQQLDRLQGATGVPVLHRDARGTPTGISLTGWSAVVGMAALVIAVLGGAVLALRHLRGGRHSYTLVTKSAPPQGESE